MNLKRALLTSRDVPDNVVNENTTSPSPNKTLLFQSRAVFSYD